MTTTIPKPRNIYSPSLQVLSPPGETPAQQQFKKDCDINIIMEKVLKGQAVDHTAKYQPEYGFTNPLNYQDSMNLIAKADSMFEDLPSKIRNEFANNPQAFLQFVQDPKNAEKAKELGLQLAPKAALEAKKIAEALQEDEAKKTDPIPATSGTDEPKTETPT